MDDELIVGLYARVSSQQQADEQTIDSQVDSLRKRIRDDGQTLDAELCFLDEGYSGEVLLRPALERLRDMAYAGGLDRIYIYSPDRLSRKHAYQVLLLEELNEHDVEVGFLEPGHTTPDGRGQFFDPDARCLRGIRTRQDSGADSTRSPVRGAARQAECLRRWRRTATRYIRKQDGDGEARYDIILEEARLVREMFTWVGVEGLSLGEVARRLTERGIPTRTGKSYWNPGTIRGILVNPAYTGKAALRENPSFPEENAFSDVAWTSRGCRGAPRHRAQPR